MPVAKRRFALGRRLRALSRENQDFIAESSGNASEALLSAQTVQAYSAEATAQARFARITEDSYRSALRRITVRALLTIIIIFVVFSGILGVLWIGARDVQAGVDGVSLYHSPTQRVTRWGCFHRVPIIICTITSLITNCPA